MTRRLLAAVAATGVVAAGLILWRLAELPRRSDARFDLPATHVTMAYHVHTTRSDGTGTVEDVAVAAADAGTRVVVLADHGDGTRATDPPRYVRGVLVIDAAEVGTWAGHYVALGAQPSPYPLGGEPAAVVDDVRALGGRGIVAHPASARDGLKWRAWDAPFDGVEWLNGDSVWRDGPGELWSALLTYWWRPADTLTALVHRPTAELGEWDRLTARRPVVGLAAHDAHARIGVGGLGEPYDGAVALRAPGYGVLFSTFTNVVVLDGPLVADAPAAAGQVMDALARGRTYAVITGQRAAPVVAFTAESASRDRRASVGDYLPTEAGATITFHGAVDAPPTATSRIVCGGTITTAAPGGRIAWTTTVEAGACRLEVDLGEPFRTPWIVTNPIYARAELVKSRAPLHPPDAPRTAVVSSRRPDAWMPEHAPGSTAVATAGGPPDGAPVEFRWSLGRGPSPFAAIRLDAPADLVRADRVFVRASADRPMRLWIQLRAPGGGGQRWGRSLRLAPGRTAPQEVPLDGLVPLDGQGGTVPLDAVTAILLVVDTVYARPGDRGVVRLDGLELTMAPPAAP